MAGDNQGNVLVSTDPADGAGATWTLSDADFTNSVLAVSCPSESLCVAGRPGQRADLDRPADAAAAVWTRHPPTPSRPQRGLVPVVVECIAVEARGNVVSSGTRAMARGQWSVTDIDGNTGLTSLARLLMTLRVAGDQIGDTLVAPATR